MSMAARTIGRSVSLTEATPILLGLLDDLPGGIERWDAQAAIDLAVADVARARGRQVTVQWATSKVEGLPRGSAWAVEQGFRRLADQGVLGIIGPGIGDDALSVASLVQRLEIPTLHWSGAERARGTFLFHYQFGALESDSIVLARHLAEQGYGRVAVLQERSAIGGVFGSSFTRAASNEGLDVVATQAHWPGEKPPVPAIEVLSHTDAAALVYLGLGWAAPAVRQALGQAHCELPVFMTSSGIWGHIQPDFARHLDGFTYVDTYSDRNTRHGHIHDRLYGASRRRGPGAALFHDMAFLMVDAAVRAAPLSRTGLRDALEDNPMVPAASGQPGTMMGFGHYDRAALKGSYLVVRRWQDGQSVEV